MRSDVRKGLLTLRGLSIWGLSGHGERGVGGAQGGGHLQQQLQAAAESVQLSTGICHWLLPAPVALEDGQDGSCGGGG